MTRNPRYSPWHSPARRGETPLLPYSPPPFRGGGVGSEGVSPPYAWEPRSLARLLADIAERVARLSPSHRDPEAFHVEKHSIAREMHRLAEAMRRGAA